MRATEVWRLRRRTFAAMLLLGYARLLIALIPLHLWRDRLGLSEVEAKGKGKGAAGTSEGADAADRTAEARMLARHVERAATRAPFRTKCLPRAIALSIMLRRARIAHCVVFAVRPRGHAAMRDRLHAWVERQAVLLIGDEPGPWIELFRLGTG